MNKEILDAVYELEQQKQIDAEVLLVALEEALKAAYKKTPRGRPSREGRDRPRYRRLPRASRSASRTSS